jgi:hypothetical protein
MHWTRAVATLVIASALVACSSCAHDSTAVKTHSHVAQTLDDLAVQGRAVVIGMRQDAIDKAIAAAQEGSADPVLAAHRAAADFDSGPFLHALNAFVASKDAYVRTVLIAAQLDPPDWEHVRPALKDALAAYTELRTATGDRLPALPTDLLGGK